MYFRMSILPTAAAQIVALIQVSWMHFLEACLCPSLKKGAIHIWIFLGWYSFEHSPQDFFKEVGALVKTGTFPVLSYLLEHFYQLLLQSSHPDSGMTLVISQLFLLNFLLFLGSLIYQHNKVMVFLKKDNKIYLLIKYHIFRKDV